MSTISIEYDDQQVSVKIIRTCGTQEDWIYIVMTAKETVRVLKNRAGGNS